MRSARFQADDWYRATTLSERLASLRATGGQVAAPVDDERAKRRLWRWQASPPFIEGDAFEQRLAMDGMTEADVRQLLGEPIDAVHARLPECPGWLAELEAAYRHPRGGAEAGPDLPPGREIEGFIELVAPLVDRGRRRVRRGAMALRRAHPDAPFDPHTVDGLLCQDLTDQLVSLVGRTLVLELHVARLTGKLGGETPEARFRSFIRRLGARRIALDLLQEYPVLARQAVICVDNWARFRLEFLAHLAADWPSLRAAFALGDKPGRLASVAGRPGAGSRGGRTVLIARLSSGERLVYKPRSLAVEAHFQSLLSWLNARREDRLQFRILAVLDRGSYGWVEYVAAEGCTDESEVRRFYARLGGQLALLYALDGTDAHSENLRAAGEHPVLLDLETLFQPRVVDPQAGADDPAARTQADSVLRTSLLPYRAWATEASAGVDLSGLGARAGQLSAFPVSRWSAVGSDEMRVTRERVVLPDHGNRPTLNGADVDPLAYQDSLIAGFRDTYRLLTRYRAQLLAPDGPLARFADDEVRVVLRATRSYDVLLCESFHPQMLRDGLDHGQVFDRLWGRSASFPDRATIIRAERADLENGDIPIFTTRLNTRDLWTGGRERIPGYLPESGLAQVQRRIATLGEDDLRCQIQVIRSSLGTLAASTTPETIRAPR